MFNGRSWENLGKMVIVHGIWMEFTLWLCQNSELENGHLWWVFPLKIWLSTVVLVYQRVMGFRWDLPSGKQEIWTSPCWMGKLTVKLYCKLPEGTVYGKARQICGKMLENIGKISEKMRKIVGNDRKMMGRGWFRLMDEGLDWCFWNMMIIIFSMIFMAC